MDNSKAWVQLLVCGGFDYSSQDGDSGVPVTTISSNAKLYAMHSSNTVSYSFAAPYPVIEDKLDLD